MHPSRLFGDTLRAAAGIYGLHECWPVALLSVLYAQLHVKKLGQFLLLPQTWSEPQACPPRHWHHCMNTEAMVIGTFTHDL